jgi:hypothetical protein
MTPGDFLTGFIMVVMGLILGSLLKQAVEDYQEFVKIREDYHKEKQRQMDWKKLTQKEPDFE